MRDEQGPSTQRGERSSRSSQTPSAAGGVPGRSASTPSVVRVIVEAVRSVPERLKRPESLLMIMALLASLGAHMPPYIGLGALAEFFGGSAPSYVSTETLLDPKLIVQLGVAPVRVDVLSHFGTLTFAEVWRTRVDAKFGSVDAHYLGREQLIAEKTFFDRPQDRADVAALRAGRSRSEPTSRAKPRTRRRS